MLVAPPHPYCDDTKVLQHQQSFPGSIYVHSTNHRIQYLLVLHDRLFQLNWLTYVFTGERNPEIIQSNVKRAIDNKFPLYCLGFGFDVKFEFLETMSLQNDGSARRIYEDADADLQLKVTSFLYLFDLPHFQKQSTTGCVEIVRECWYITRVSMKRWRLLC